MADSGNPTPIHDWLPIATSVSLDTPFTSAAYGMTEPDDGERSGLSAMMAALRVKITGATTDNVLTLITPVLRVDGSLSLPVNEPLISHTFLCGGTSPYDAIFTLGWGSFLDGFKINLSRSGTETGLVLDAWIKRYRGAYR